MLSIKENNKYININNPVIFSLFDGMSCGQQAINRLVIKNYTYFSSEVDEYSTQVTRYNYPNTIFLGDVKKITIVQLSGDLVLINDKYIVNTKYLILIGGSPCQGFSFAGKMCGATTECNIDITSLEQYLELKKNQFEFKGQSYLFWEYIRIKSILENINPELIFLLENVNMAKKWKNTFNSVMNVDFSTLDSSLVSAQNRKRLYWSNLSDEITKPIDKKIYLRDIIQYKVFKDLLPNDILLKNYDGSNRLNPNYKSQANLVMSENEKSQTLCAGTHGYANGHIKFYMPVPKNLVDIGLTRFGNLIVRKLSPVECERLQTVKDNFTAFGFDENFNKTHISPTQRYKMLGNGWTVDIIVHIMRELKIKQFFQSCIDKIAA